MADLKMNAQAAATDLTRVERIGEWCRGWQAA